MRYFLILILISKFGRVLAQDGSAAFDSKFEFRNGIYSSKNEVLENNPKYPDCTPEVRSRSLLGVITSFNYYTAESEKKVFADSLYAYAKNGILVIYAGDDFRRLVVTGPISLFYTESTVSYANGYSHTDDKLYFIDWLTGQTGKMNWRNLSEVFKRDYMLYAEYLKLSDARRKKTLYAGIIKYNKRNPIYIPAE